MKVAKTLNFNDSTRLVRQFVDEYNKIQGYINLKPNKILKLRGNVLMKKALNKAFTIHLFEGDDSYKNTLIKLDGCVYIVIHLGGYYSEEEIGKFINRPLTIGCCGER